MSRAHFCQLLTAYKRSTILITVDQSFEQLKLPLKHLQLNEELSRLELAIQTYDFEAAQSEVATIAMALGFTQPS